MYGSANFESTIPESGHVSDSGKFINPSTYPKYQPSFNAFRELTQKMTRQYLT